MSQINDGLSRFHIDCQGAMCGSDMLLSRIFDFAEKEARRLKTTPEKALLHLHTHVSIKKINEVFG